MINDLVKRREDMTASELFYALVFIAIPIVIVAYNARVALSLNYSRVDTCFAFITAVWAMFVALLFLGMFYV